MTTTTGGIATVMTNLLGRYANTKAPSEIARELGLEVNDNAEFTNNDTKIDSKAMLRIPKGKGLSDLPLEHYSGLIEKGEMSYQQVVRALLQEERTNKKSNPKVAGYARKIFNRLSENYQKKVFGKADVKTIVEFYSNILEHVKKSAITENDKGLITSLDEIIKRNKELTSK